VSGVDFSGFESLDGGLMFYALLGCLAALVIGAAWWALGHHAANPHHAGRGKAAVGAALVGALLVGAGPLLVGFFTKVGSRIITYNVDRANGRIVQAQITMIVQTYCRCAWQRAHVGEPIQIQYEFINSGQRPVASVRARGDRGPAACPRRQLAAGQTVVCTATHQITAADLAAGQYTATGSASGVAGDGTVLSTSADAQSIRLWT
jgi:hypothetical protein